MSPSHRPSSLRLRSLFSSPRETPAPSIDSADSSSLRQSRAVQRDEQRERRANEKREFDLSVRMRRRKSEELAQIVETPEQRSHYGNYGLYHVEDKPWDHLDEMVQLNQLVRSDPSRMQEYAGRVYRFRVRLHVARHMSAHLTFFVFRERGITMQGVLNDGSSTEHTPHMMHWAMRLPSETLLLVQGTLQAPREPVFGCMISHLELMITDLHVVAHLTDTLPFTVEMAERAHGSHLEEHSDLGESFTDGDSSVTTDLDSMSHQSMPVITQRTRLMNRLVDLRRPTTQAIFRVQSTICQEFRSYLSARGFTETHTPKLQGGASESGSSVFQVAYFGRDAFLAQSPQLYKQMCIAADMHRVYEVGPVFRAENSNTARHMTEYTGLDLEMEINHYYDALAMIDGMLKHIFTVLHERCHDAIDLVRQHYPSTEFQWLERTLVLPFPEGIRMLREAGYVEEDGSPPSEFEDLHTRGEIRLGELVKERYGTDYYVLDKFPASARPFYTMPDEHDPRRTNSFDIFVRGQEICTGGQRIHQAEMLEENIRHLGIDAAPLEEYLEGFRFGAPPHAGCGIGLERLVMLYLNLDDIRLASLFFRDPKSFAIKNRGELRHPDASTNPPPWKKSPDMPHELQPLEKLIANYGDSSNTSWLDPRFKVWRDEETGAAVGYSCRRHHVLIVGNPLCDTQQMSRVIGRFLTFVQSDLRLKPVWLMVGESVEQMLAGRYGWCTLSCTADQRVRDVRRNPARQDPEILRKLRHAQKVGVTIQEISITENVPEALQAECDESIASWHRHRRGTQVHLTSVQPWSDQAHRYYFFARDSDKRLCCLVVLAQLAPEFGYQVKWAISFPDAPSGAIEMTILHALDTVSSSSVTFGTAAASQLLAVHGLSGIAFRVLSRIYNSVTERTNLQSKSEFRDKLGTVKEPTYTCYPKGSISMFGVREIVDFFRESPSQ